MHVVYWDTAGIFARKVIESLVQFASSGLAGIITASSRPAATRNVQEQRDPIARIRGYPFLSDVHAFAGLIVCLRPVNSRRSLLSPSCTRVCRHIATSGCWTRPSGRLGGQGMGTPEFTMASAKVKKYPPGVWTLPSPLISTWARKPVRFGRREGAPVQSSQSRAVSRWNRVPMHMFVAVAQLCIDTMLRNIFQLLM